MSAAVPEQGTFRSAERLRRVSLSQIVALSWKAAALRKAGRNIIALGTGEPDFDTPDHVKEAAAQAMAAGETKYTTLDGTLALKEAIAAKFLRDNNLRFSTDEITVSNGAKQILFNAMMATLDPGDEVIIPTPFWVSYSDIVAIAGGTPVFVPCRQEDGFRLSAEALEAAITPRTRWLMLNSPSNPSGAAYGAEHYRPLIEVLLRHPRLWLVADDIYEHILYDGFRFVTPAALEPSLAERTLTVNGVSKAYAMTGWRIGYAGGPRALISAMAVVQSQATSCPSSISQAAAIAALNGPQEEVERRRQAFQVRRDLVVGALNSIPGLGCRRPEGAFYAYPSCAGLISSITPSGAAIGSDADLAEYLLDEAGVGLVHGAAFGLSPHLRLSYAASTSDLEIALERIAAAVTRLRSPAK